MTWAQHCDGPACRKDGVAMWTLKEPAADYDPDETDRHFCSRDCVLRWAANIDETIAAVEVDRKGGGPA